LVLPIIVYTHSSTKLEIRAKLFLAGSEWVGREREEVGKREGKGRRGKK
jgi:hypothetical protein